MKVEPRANGNSENIQSLSSRRQRNHQLIDYSNFPHTRINNVYWLIFKTQKSENCVVWFFRIYRILPERITGRDKGETGSLVSVQIMSVELQWPASAPPLDIGLLMSESDTATPRPAPAHCADWAHTVSCRPGWRPHGNYVLNLVASSILGYLRSCY